MKDQCFRGGTDVPIGVKIRTVITVHLPTLDRLELRTVPDETGAMPLDQIVVWERQSRF